MLSTIIGLSKMKKTTYTEIVTLYDNRLKEIIDIVQCDPKRFDDFEPKLFELSGNLMEIEALKDVDTKKKISNKKISK